MRDNKLKVVLYTVGGAAVLAGTYIYFKRRNMTLEQKYSLLFNQFSQQILSFKQLNQSNFQLKYDKLLHLAIQEENNSSSSNQLTLADQISFSDVDAILNQGACSQEINAGGYYYDCFDCSPARQENAQTLNGIEIDTSYQILCEDCFKTEEHKNHKFKRVVHPGIVNAYCQCGNESLVNKKCFCKKHQGFDKIKQLYDDQLFKQPRLWKSIETFLIDSFYYYIQIVSVSIQQKLDKVIDEKTYNQNIQGINYFLQLIINKINEILELNPPSTYLISSILLKSFEKPISFKIKKNQQQNYPDKYIRLIQKQKEINQDLTILDCLLLSYEVICPNSDKYLSKLFYTLALADEKFATILCEKFFRMIGFIASTQKSKDEWIYKSKLPTFTHIIMENIYIQRTFDHILNTLGADIFNMLEYLAFYIQKKLIFQQGEVNEIVVLLPNVTFDMFKQVQQIKTLMQRYPKELVNAVNNLNQALFFGNLINYQNTLSDKQLLQSWCDSLVFFTQFVNIEVNNIDAQIQVFQALKLINDEELTKNMISIMCDSFREHIQKISDLTEEKENFYTLSVSSLTILPYLVAISEKKMFTQSSIQKFFNDQFSFKCEEEKIHFFKCLRKVLSKFILFEADLFNIIFQCLSMIGMEELAQVVKESVFNPTYKIYDIFIFVHSIILLADNNSNTTTQNNPPQKLIEKLQKPLQNNKQLNSGQSFYTSQLIYQILLDSTPFLNLFSKTFQLFFSEVCSSEVTQIKKIIKSNVEELVVTCINKNNLEKMNLNDLEEICSVLIDDQNIVKLNYKEVLDQDESEQFIFLRKQYTQKFYSRHLLRNQFNEVFNDIKKVGLKNRKSEEEYTFAGSDFSLEKLFPYQQEIFKKIFLDEEYVRQIISVCLDQTQFIVKIQENLILYLLLKFIVSKDQSEIMSEEEKKQIEKIIQILPLEKLKEQFIDEIDCLKQQTSIDLLITAEKILEMLKQISQNEK
ncbi:N-recognin zinc finger protein (macronuclear) [Tetrahymena thermophila SB210]|uniref:N-recognin zinc finger protein n=1 Tax=Tetrahymena thermophila (strain SB210) TaxID=312017 RepID=Q23C11_TETTS|nr:N-recognin zinc finger protein [Tetrahymena thermophila SB210]EAR93957.1 N-recognin zinc finger protein [Tetrahymena thermophila SB210]|eukprot:XP_001014202.1 N-recognin zinc finger protein [Tetrahymena thermophila SB210]